ncbi:BamA/TamA family outer membrane protein [Scytonema sp. UIC 10036]|uniref:ShlB/FhaC/HecB family hemolysin secretion/activation protein n=1 Tax=Scytonema sp. UIC 10036 TaxID=2304196 RepID=UPI0012DA49A4|nr:ShlB/FhaC/HecB family hemolysin secretion/activation protein [Scytonema sp. UIC 10036]MUG97315.1 BamA/TamA family outer membrane protein [Scytonema sp. UIC 10036]
MKIKWFQKILTLSTLTLSLLIHTRIYAVEVAQAPPPNLPPQPKLPRDLPPPQDVTPPVTEPPQQPQAPSPPPPQENLLPTTPTPQLEKSPEAEFPEDFPIVITRFEFLGSTVFKDEELLRVIEDALNGVSNESDENSPKPDRNSVPTERQGNIRLPRTEQDKPVTLTFAQLLQARSAITNYYIKKEYITSGALIPEQTIAPKGGVVRIQIVEGSIEEIRVIGTRRLNQNYIRSRVALGTKKPLNRKRLLDALRVLQIPQNYQQYSLIESLSAELSAGSRFGSNLLEVKIKEARSFHTFVNLDNNRSPSVGSFQRGIELREDNLLGIGDSLSGVYTNTDGSDKFDFSYVVPLSPRNTTLTLSYNTTSSNIIEEPFDVLDISSESREYRITLSHPIILTPTQELTLGLTGSHQQIETSLGFKDIGSFPLSPGSDNQGRTRITALRFFQQWIQRGDRSALALRSQFNFGLDALDATINKVEPDGQFFAWRGQAQWVRSFAKDTLLVLRGDIQVSDRRLVPSEQFALGGLSSVRGYRQDALISDNGFFGSVEARLPILRIPRVRGLLQVAPFVDFGTTWNNFETAESRDNTLASVGLGLRLRIDNTLDARFDWGIPLIAIDSDKRTLQENGVYFSVIWNPF